MKIVVRSGMTGLLLPGMGIAAWSQVTPKPIEGDPVRIDSGLVSGSRSSRKIIRRQPLLAVAGLAATRQERDAGPSAQSVPAGGPPD